MYPLAIKVLAVEYQFDRSKMFVYYTAGTRVDFRELVKTIFARCKVRIWMMKVNRNDTFAPYRFAETALATGISGVGAANMGSSSGSRSVGGGIGGIGF